MNLSCNVSHRNSSTDPAFLACRRLGPREVMPLIVLQHFSATLDTSDPSLVNGLVAPRPIMVFANQSGRSVKRPGA
jgi:hypothetical protein